MFDTLILLHAPEKRATESGSIMFGLRSAITKRFEVN